MYRPVRNVHLFLGLLFSVFLGMYAFSAAQMGHEFLPQPYTEPVERELAVDPSSDGARALADQLIRDHGLKGSLQNVRTTSVSVAFYVFRMKDGHKVTWTRGADTAHVISGRPNLWEVFNRMHEVAGFSNPDWVENVWGVVLLLTSLGLLALGATGIYMWMKRKKERTLGVVLLASHLVVALALIAMMRAAG